MHTVENTWQEIRNAGVEVAVLPFGAIEQHGPHLPIGTDWLVAQAVARSLAEELGALLLPALPYGTSGEHMAFAGTVTLRPSTLAALFEDIVVSLRAHGVRRIVVVSTHGGNWVLKPTLRELNHRYPDIKVIWADGVLPERGDVLPEDIHAGRGETAAMLHLRPDLVREVTRDLDDPGALGQEFLDYVGMDLATSQGVWGRPSEATAQLGEERMAERVRRQAEYVRWALRKIDELEARAVGPQHAPGTGRTGV
jgi:creatinine amidohydrolase